MVFIIYPLTFVFNMSTIVFKILDAVLDNSIPARAVPPNAAAGDAGVNPKDP
jgi:hypothetical protein